MGDAPADTGPPPQRRRTRRVLKALKCQVVGCSEDLLLPYHKVGDLARLGAAAARAQLPRRPLPLAGVLFATVLAAACLPAPQKYHVCATHFKSESLLMEEGGELVRFCQKCGRFQVQPAATPRHRRIQCRSLLHRARATWNFGQCCPWQCCRPPAAAVLPGRGSVLVLYHN